MGKATSKRQGPIKWLLYTMLALLCAACTLSASDLQYSHPGIPTEPICDKPLDVPDNVNLWGFNYTTKELVTDPVELRLFDHADVFFEYHADAPKASASS